MSAALFPGEPSHELEAGMRRHLVRDDAAVFVFTRSAGAGLAGFLEVGARSHADGCVTSPVAYLEAWYVDPDARGRGLGRALLEAAETWARGRGYVEMASDTLLANLVGQAAHRRCGFTEVDRVVEYRKALR